MLSKKMEKAISEQINAELYSAYLYLSMEAHFESVNLKGFANWMRIQTMEEVLHAQRFFDYVHEKGGKVALKAIAGPTTEWGTPLEVFEAVYKHECKITGLINKLVDKAIAESDHATNITLQWFVTEQIEEEASADAIVQKLKLMADAPGGMFLLDQELGQRVFTPPATGKGA